MLNVNYPAVFHLENNSYWVEFPDLEGCFSDGSTLEEAYNHAKEALGIYLDRSNETFKRTINKPSEVKDVINKFKDDVVMLVNFDSIEYGKKYNNKAIKKTLSIPSWLNDIAIKNNINFSNVLQEALIQKITK